MKYLFAFLMLVGVFGCADKEAQKQAKAQMQQLSDKTVPVTFVQPKIMDVQATLDVNGPMKSLDEVQLGARVPGRLTMVAVKDGSPVRRGQTIAQVETADLMQQVQQAQAAVQVAESARAQAAINARISPQQTKAAIRQAQAALNSAKAKLTLVRKGARSQERAQAQERVNQGKAKLDKAKADLDRAKKLFEGGAIARSDVDAAQWQYDSALTDYRSSLEALDALIEGARPEEISQAEEAVRSAQEQLQSAKAGALTDDVRRQQVQQAEASLRQARASLRLAQMQMYDAAVVSPVDGFVSGKTAQVGQVMSVGTPVATVVSLSGVYLEAQIPEKEIPNVTIGQSAVVKLDAWPNRTFAGTIVAVRPSADSLGRLFAARIAINDRTGALRPGMFGKAKIIESTIRGAVMLPVDAVLTQENKSYVYVANGKVAKRIDVRLGKTQNGWVQVIGLAPGQKVIYRGKDAVTDGTQIREDKQAVVEASR